jgi:hypothetical protein
VTRTICGLAVGSRIASMTACFGRQLGWPAWTWPCLLGAALAAGAFVVWERRLADHGGRPILDVGLFTLPGVGSGVLTVWLIMGGYGAFLLMLTLHLQGSLHFTPLHAGLISAIYAFGFASASLTWTRAPQGVRAWLPSGGSLAMGAALLAIGLLAGSGGWPAAATAPLLLLAGAGHALGFSPWRRRAPLTLWRSPPASSRVCSCWRRSARASRSSGPA